MRAEREKTGLLTLTTDNDAFAAEDDFSTLPAPCCARWTPSCPDDVKRCEWRVTCSWYIIAPHATKITPMLAHFDHAEPWHSPMFLLLINATFIAPIPHFIYTCTPTLWSPSAAPAHQILFHAYSEADRAARLLGNTCNSFMCCLPADSPTLNPDLTSSHTSDAIPSTPIELYLLDRMLLKIEWVSDYLQLGDSGEAVIR